jgi:AcrR family transcriptional regulator
MAKKTVTQEDKALKIKEAYIQYVLENGAQPASVYKFMKDLRMKEATFYQYYNSFTALNKQVWAGFARKTIESCEAEEAFQAYSGREKLLAFYFTLIEVLKEQRSFVLQGLHEMKRPQITPEFLSIFKQHFLKFIDSILLEAKETDEVVDRPFISDRYGEGLWLQVLFVLNFWSKDESKDFEKTDAAIEKAVHLSFDLMGKSALDSMVDFAKFLYQNR